MLNQNFEHVLQYHLNLNDLQKFLVLFQQIQLYPFLGNVLLQYFKIDYKIIDYVAERNPAKYNLFTPGSKIKIISEKDSRAMHPDYYLVLPWHFKKEILKREKITIKKGSKFISIKELFKSTNT